jgi:hypothetical protein
MMSYLDQKKNCNRSGRQPVPFTKERLNKTRIKKRRIRMWHVASAPACFQLVSEIKHKPIPNHGSGGGSVIHGQVPDRAPMGNLRQNLG